MIFCFSCVACRCMFLLHYGVLIIFSRIDFFKIGDPVRTIPITSFSNWNKQIHLTINGHLESLSHETLLSFAYIVHTHF